METEEEGYSPKWILLALLAVALVLLVGVAASLAVPLQPPLGGSGAPAGAGNVVMPSGVGSNTRLNFSPAIITVIIGTNNSVTWANRDTVTHTVTATDGSFNSGDIHSGSSWSYTFSTPGNYTYYCIYHSSWMRGTVVVRSS